MRPINKPTGIKIQLKKTAEMNPNKSLLIKVPTRLALCTASGWTEPLRIPLSVAREQTRGNPMNGETKPAISHRLSLDRLMNRLIKNHNVNETSMA